MIRTTMHIIYLDQCAVSNIAKAKDGFWVQLSEKLRLWTRQQRIVCPASQFHYEESLLSKDWRGELQAVYQQLAGPYRFRPLEAIETAQLLAVLRSQLGEAEDSRDWQALEESREDDSNSAEALDVSGIRQRREEALHDMQRQSEGFHDFQSARTAEIRRYAEAIVRKHAEVVAGSTLIMQELKQEVLRRRPGEPNPEAVVRELFESEWVESVPFLDLRSRLGAAIAQHAHSRVKPRRPKAGDICDMQAVSHYGPYCAAMFLDNEFRKLACQRNVDVPGRYGVRVFSETNREEFGVYLDGLA